MSDDVRIDRDERGVTTITFDRPDKMNAIDGAMMTRMRDAFKRLPGDAACRVVVIRGEGANFSAGGDMAEIDSMAVADGDARAAAVAAAIEKWSQPLALALADVPQPVVASVRGHAIGVALQLVLMADLVVASRTARFSMPQLQLGHTPDHGESWALSRKVGLSRALQMCLLAERIDGKTAERYGLANWVVPDDQLEARTEATVKRLLSLAPLASRSAKALLRQGMTRTLAQALDAEVATMRTVAAQDDFAEAIDAYVHRRKPAFTGR